MQEVETESRRMKARLLSPDGRTEPQPPARSGRVARLFYTLAGAAAIGTLLYASLIRPWHLQWGATGEEGASVLPGDELIGHPRLQSTRGITIQAPASRIWPWLVQMGQGRGGLYSYDWLENIVGCDIHSLDRVAPEFQSLQAGDTFRLGPQGYPFFTVASITPQRAIVLATPLQTYDMALLRPACTPARHVTGSTWAFVLTPVDEHTTRLLVRLRGDWDESVGATLFNRALLEPANFVMERKMIYGIKERAEGAVAGE